ncbi:MAG: glycoside hydrolase family 43 protein [Defluviitaleaceae bacterium]|nr:glycoside hydrolase family 43 protein [Defluviitaleaceae bacterium]
MYTLKNPIISGYYPDPSICKDEKTGDYYLVTSSFEFFPGVPVFRSRDLINWEQVGHCLTRPEQLPLKEAGASGGIYAPTIRYHQGKFYMVTTNVSSDGHFFVTADDPAGEWSDLIWIKDSNGERVNGIDPSLFFDDDGKVYFTYTDYGMKQAEIDLKTGRVGEIRNTWGGIGGRNAEAPHLYKIDGKYYLLLAEGGTETGHMVTIARSDSPWGPFESCPHNPILSNSHTYSPVQATGHGDLIIGPDGKWWMVFLAFRTTVPYFHHLGRETNIVPVDWENGWPMIKNYTNLPCNCGTIDTEIQIDRNINEHKYPATPSRMDFSKLSFDWVYLRNPDFSKYSVSEGVLTLESNKQTLSCLNASPTAIFRRQKEFDICAKTSLIAKSLPEGGETGMTIYYDHDHHYDFALTRKDDGKIYVIVRKTVGDMVVEAFCRECTEKTELTIRADKLKYYFILNDEEVATGMTQYVSTEATICSFTGVLIGLYAQKGALGAFEWFEALYM